VRGISPQEHRAAARAAAAGEGARMTA